MAIDCSKTKRPPKPGTALGWERPTPFYVLLVHGGEPGRVMFSSLDLFSRPNGETLKGHLPPWAQVEGIFIGMMSLD